MARIQIDLAREDVEAIEELRSLGEAAIIAQPDHFEGSMEIVSAIVSVTMLSMPHLVRLIEAHIKSKRYIKVKMKGVEVNGASLKDVAKFLKDLQEDR